MKKIKYNDVGFKDSFIDISRDGRKKSEAKKKGEHGPKYIRNPDKLKSTMDPSAPKISKEQYVRSGQRKEKRAEVVKTTIGAILIAAAAKKNKR
jgi:hypothetical protein|tara:strand:- start:234 stop:515 length:282 start_codon:yes stop_codon:yes gene_type:complete